MKRAPTGGPGAEPVAARVAEPVALLAQARCDDPRPLRHGALIGWLDWIRRPVRRGSALDPALPVSRVQHLLAPQSRAFRVSVDHSHHFLHVSGRH